MVQLLGVRHLTLGWRQTPPAFCHSWVEEKGEGDCADPLHHHLPSLDGEGAKEEGLESKSGVGEASTRIPC